MVTAERTSEVSSADAVNGRVELGEDTGEVAVDHIVCLLATARAEERRDESSVVVERTANDLRDDTGDRVHRELLAKSTLGCVECIRDAKIARRVTEGATVCQIPTPGAVDKQ